MVKSRGVVALVFVLSLLLGACASSGSIPVTELPRVTRTGVQPGDQMNITFYTAAGTRLSEISVSATSTPTVSSFCPFSGRSPWSGWSPPRSGGS